MNSITPAETLEKSSASWREVPSDIREQIQGAYDRLVDAEAFNSRRGQKLMIGRISRQFQAALGSPDGNIDPGDPFILVEAGTGVGKTVAYLLPGLVFASHYQKTLVVSTATANLQDQVLNKDIPLVTRHLEGHVNVSLVKGRGRYLCASNLDLLVSDGGAAAEMAYFDQGMGGLTAEQQQLYAQLAASSQSGQWDGDRDHWPEAMDDRLWRPLTSTRRSCAGPRCSHYDDCAFYRARQEIEQADCLVVNHDLLLADLALGGGVILPPPEDCIYVFDEAHHLAERARQHLACRLAPLQLANLLDEADNSLVQFSKWPGISARLRDACLKTGELKFQIDEPLSALIKQTQELKPDEGQSVKRFPAGELPNSLVELCDELRLPVTQLLVNLEGLSEELQKAADEGQVKQGDLTSLLNLVGDWCTRLESWCGLLVDWSDANRAGHTSARWLNFYPGGGFELHSSPLEVGDTLADQLWQRAAASVFTSATLGVAGDFNRTRAAIGLDPQVDALAIGSPFDYPRIGRLCICKDAPDPRDPSAYDDYLVEFLQQRINQAEASLVLFNSIAQMERVLDRIDKALQQLVLVQGKMSRAEILRKHKERVDQGQGSLIFGLRSFAEGVDLPGDYCTHLVITRIPFSVPDDPVDATLAELLQQQGKNPFREVSLPGAALRLVQAVGRLIRSENDSGIVSVVDSRLSNRSYGRYLLSALPPLRVEEFQLET